ncbi:MULTISPECIES: GNAT family N-acetyltransferase [unclassified Fusibacter]|uniref:GNAT family N-acetyltransferase n=1 Tax=unclassified Fusibacter TaxID=2624464 RepID=UPI0010124954|nr:MULTISPECIES: GNAT family N-acetyltransferase [unclassified Fusibacter]MCK8060936.1 GNAT family N-acetyltransferase [Fusibacter sp. A2]NPE23232.1 GNAT family N-acetyltransferase [Fusibacter sp. A1]RXV59587.1 GNAT family N-acetyltransferase [Fusibacter sp. A1]
MKIRAMKKEDKTFVAPLIRSAIEDLSELFTQSEAIDIIDSRLERLIEAQETRFSHVYGLVCEIDGKVAGAGLAYLAGEMRRLTFNSIAIIESEGITFDLQVKRDLLCSREANEDEFYIDNLAVYPDFQNRGIGGLLLDAFEQKAKAEGHDKLSILADLENPRARELYLRRGYEEDCIMKVLGHEYHHLVKYI